MESSFSEMESSYKVMKSSFKVLFFDYNLRMVATIAALWYLPHGRYGTYHKACVVGTIM